MDLSRASSFPSAFTFGVSTSSVQLEGGTREGGRGQGIWDTFCASPGNVFDGSTPEIACDHFHKFKEDILVAKKLGVDAYRFSLSWPRLFPESSDKVNEEGVAFYNELIDCITEAGLIPFATIYHWDLPQFLQDDPLVKGWSTKHIVRHFLTLAETCFKHFGDRVKHWITLNEIRMNAIMAYEFGIMAPGKSSDPGANPYTTAHHQLLCHAATVKLYRKSYQEKQQGVIGLSADVICYEPMSAKQEDVDAAVRCVEFDLGWILDPVQFGDYSQTMKDLVGDRLPTFSGEESRDLKDSIDFIGLNYYTSLWVTNAEKPEGVISENLKVLEDLSIVLREAKAQIHWKDEDGNCLGEASGRMEQAWFRSCPQGLRGVLAELKNRYGDMPIYITENGTLDPDSSAMPDGPLNDQKRIKFIQDHLSVLSESIRVDKVNVKGYFYWTFMDNWEWSFGFTSRFGLYYIDFSDPNLEREPKASAKWFTLFLSS